MQLVSYQRGSEASYGIVKDGGIVDLSKRLGPKLPTLMSLLQADALRLASEMSRSEADFALSDVMLLPPIVAPEKIWCIGVNYADRNEEYKDNSAAPKYPSLFCRAPTSVVGHGTPLERPRVSGQLDYEGEIVVIIGRGGRHIPKDRALDHIAGLTIGNEGTIRDWLRHGNSTSRKARISIDREASAPGWSRATPLTPGSR